MAQMTQFIDARADHQPGRVDREAQQNERQQSLGLIGRDRHLPRRRRATRRPARSRSVAVSGGRAEADRRRHERDRPPRWSARSGERPGRAQPRAAPARPRAAAAPAAGAAPAATRRLKGPSFAEVLRTAGGGPSSSPRTRVQRVERRGIDVAPGRRSQRLDDGRRACRRQGRPRRGRLRRRHRLRRLGPQPHRHHGGRPRAHARARLHQHRQRRHRLTRRTTDRRGGRRKEVMPR